MNIISESLIVMSNTISIPKQDINILYPIVCGNVNTMVLRYINNDILSSVNALKNQQIGNAINQGYQNFTFTMDGWYEVKNNQRNVLSLILGNYFFPYPAAHGMTILMPLTYDTITGRKYNLSELFLPNSDYVDVLSREVEKQIKERDIPILGEFTEINPNQYFYIADRSIILFYQLYELAPYAYGFPFFPISIYSIQNLIPEDGILQRMIAST